MPVMEQYRDRLGRLRKRRMRCINHEDEYAGVCLVYKMVNGLVRYEPVCDRCREVYEDYDERLRPELTAELAPHAAPQAVAGQRMCGNCGAWVTETVAVNGFGICRPCGEKIKGG